MSDLRAFVANCLMGGDDITRDGENWTRDLVMFNCDGFTFIFRQKRDVIIDGIEHFVGTFAKTSEVLVKGVKESEVTKVLEILDRVCWLLSFVGLCRVMCYGHEYPNASGLTHFCNVIGTAEHFRPLLDIRYGTAVKNFVEQTYGEYRRLEKTRKLNVVIDYLVQAERSSQVTELRLILAFVVLENLKDTYAKSRSIPYIKGYFRKPSTRAGKPGANFRFEELLEMMLREMRMKKGLKRVIQLRNEIIHSGLSRKPHSRQLAMYESIHDLIREYVIRLLGYHGCYLTYASEGSRTVQV